MPDAAPAPTLTLTLSETRMHVGGTVTLSWSATGASSCEALGAWSGAREPSGSEAITPSEGGRHVHRMRCQGAGGSVEQSVTLTVPMPVLPSSYENAKHIRMDEVLLPSPQAIGVAEATWFWSFFAFGDFFQEGAYSVVVPMARWQTPEDQGPPNAPGSLHILHRDPQGQWRDATSELLSERATCVHPRKLLVADFNEDRRPDVFFACHGFDAPPFPGESQRLLLSRPDGRYDNVSLPFSGYSHGGAAADLDGDEHIDVVLTLTNQPGARPYVLLGHGDGTFTRDDGRIPEALADKPIYSVELIDLRRTGNYDLLIGGVPIESMPEPDPLGSFPNGFLRNDGDGRFLETPMIELPNPPGSTGVHYSLALDFVLVGDDLFVHQVDFGYTGVVVHKVRLSDRMTTRVYEHRGAYADDAKWFAWIYPTADGRFIIQQANCAFPPAPASSCAVSFAR